MFSPTFPEFFHNYSQFEQLKKEKTSTSYWSTTVFFLTFPVEKEIIRNRYSIKKSVDSEFMIGEPN